MHHYLLPAPLLLLLLLFTTPSTSAPGSSCPSPSNPGHNHARCTTTHPLLTLDNITYSSSTIYSTPAHLAVAQGTISFNLSTSAVPYTTHCSAFSSQPYDFFYGNVVYRCDTPVGEGVEAGAQAVFTFSVDGTFAVNQTWGCVDMMDHKK